VFPFLIGTVRTLEGKGTMKNYYIVSIPHRYGKNGCDVMRLLEKLAVSIPHRYGKNPKHTITPVMLVQVSIPHRYGKNLFSSHPSTDFARFPFLIGTVRTNYYHHTHFEHLTFPFLIGTVRTNIRKLCL